MITASPDSPAKPATPLADSLDELAVFIRQCVPDGCAISDIKVQKTAGAVTFRWHGAEFLVNPALDVYEVRNRYMYVTNVSMLLHTILTRRKTKELMLEGTVQRLKEAEELICARNQPREAVLLIDQVAKDLNRQSHRSKLPSPLPASPAS